MSVMLPLINSKNSTTASVNQQPSAQTSAVLSVALPAIESASKAKLYSSIKELSEISEAMSLVENLNQHQEALRGEWKALNGEVRQIRQELEGKARTLKEFCIDGPRHPVQKTSDEIWSIIRESDRDIREAMKEENDTIPYSMSLSRSYLQTRIEFIQGVIRSKIDEYQGRFSANSLDLEGFKEVLKEFKQEYETCRLICSDLKETWREELEGRGMGGIEAIESDLTRVRGFASIVLEVLDLLEIYEEGTAKMDQTQNDMNELNSRTLQIQEEIETKSISNSGRTTPATRSNTMTPVTPYSEPASPSTRGSRFSSVSDSPIPFSRPGTPVPSGGRLRPIPKSFIARLSENK